MVINLKRALIMTPKEAAKKLNVSYQSIIHYIRTGRLKAIKEKGRWNVDQESIEKFEKPNKPGAGRPPGPNPAKSRGKRSIYLGLDIAPEEIIKIREWIRPANLRGYILFRLAELAENEPEKYKHVLGILGIETDQ